MRFEYESAAHIQLLSGEAELHEVRNMLTYVNTQAQAEARRHKHATWFINKFGRELWQEKLDELEAKVEVCLLEGDRTLSGFVPRLRERGYTGYDFVAPEYTNRPVVCRDRKQGRYYQVDAVEAAVEARHCAISLPTGSGKSWIIEELLRRIGLKAVVVAPTESIASQLYKELCRVFGRNRVGFYGDGKKDSKKDIVVGIAAGLYRVDEESPHYDTLRNRDVFIFDESHLAPANSFKKICLGFGATAAYRFFLSATQFRNDGADLLLEGITGPVVYEKGFAELVAEGFLAKPNHYGFIFESPHTYFSKRTEDMQDRHFYDNVELHMAAADVANQFWRLDNRPVVILVDHVAQFMKILPRLRIRTGFAHGTLDKKQKETVPEEFRSDDTEALVDAFNAGELPCLVGTSCIATGTDLRPTGTLINMQGGKSEIKWRQGRGRATRIEGDKREFNHVDFGVRVPRLPDGKNPLMRHFWERMRYCEPEFKPQIVDLPS